MLEKALDHDYNCLSHFSAAAAMCASRALETRIFPIPRGLGLFCRVAVGRVLVLSIPSTQTAALQRRLLLQLMNQFAGR